MDDDDDDDDSNRNYISYNKYLPDFGKCINI